MRRVPVSLCILSLSTGALGAPPRAKTAEHAPLPNVSLAIDAPSARGAWTMRVTNDGDVPVRIAADARLLEIEVTPRGARNAVRCTLPADMRPEGDLESAIVLPPKRVYAESFEPRLFCFGAREAGALDPGAAVVAHLGWARAGGSKPPFEVAPIDGVQPIVAPRKAIDSPAIALPDDPTPARIPVSVQASDDPLPARLDLRGPRAIDAESIQGLEVAVTLRNDGSHAVVVRLRPETLAFDVVGPHGAEHCAWPANPSAPTRDLFTTLAPKGSTSLSVLLTAYCTGHTFDHPGLLVVRPRLDTRKASGAEVGLRTFDGQVISTGTTIVRLHRGTAPNVLRRPRLRPAP